ncbi:hypothetical protein Mhypo_03396 [Meiothermus hypogaeus]|uniref:Uncharacterized protein n=1 Tax=Meiothermus hypogaeus TaxID=884155 RepID=A0ABX9MH78_9DEIN|nr:hypothetical protein Mhypo_03396 [Meiothermus hypogaeus]
MACITRYRKERTGALPFICNHITPGSICFA